MREYVSDIIVQGKSVSHVAMPMFPQPVIKISDGSEFVEGQEYYGCNRGAGGYSLVKHSPVEAKLYEYISFAETLLHDPLVGTRSDFCFLNEPAQVGKWREKNKVRLDINSGWDEIRLRGPSGSIVWWMNGSGIKVTTLYKMLCEVCRRTHLNVMQYREIQLGNTDAHYATRVGFVHNEEADRFFLKMFVLASRG